MSHPIIEREVAQSVELTWRAAGLGEQTAEEVIGDSLIATIPGRVSYRRAR